MRRALIALAILAGSVPVSRGAEPETVSSAAPRTPEQEKSSFRLPPGFVIELVASEPEIHKPLNLAFDDQGRLWVTDTIEYPFAVGPGKEGRDGVKILSNFGEDGRAKSVSTWTSGLNIPIGLLPMPSGREALVHSIPKVFRITDADGDGKADVKEPLYASYGFKDTHGMTNAFTWGFDGWVYACHGFANDSKVQGADKQAIVMQSGNTYRMRPDGSHAEYYAHGMVNPFGLAFDPLGNLYACDCHSRPVYQLLRGGYYPSFGRPDDGLGFAPEMATHDHGSTGIAGIVYYAAEQFPKAYRDRVYIGNVVTNRINQDVVEWHGSSPKAIEQPDFLVSDDPWFRPVDIELGPDGALYIADFYNRIIGHYEVPLTHPGRDRERGRIWRIVYRGEGSKPTPVADLTKAQDAALVSALGDPNLSVRLKAANQLAVMPEPKRPTAALRAAFLDKNAFKRAQALWVMQRWGSLADDLLVRASMDPDRLVRVHAMRILSERGPVDESLAGLARGGLQDEDAQVRRAAAEALGKSPKQENVLPLLALLERTSKDDAHLIHATRIALRDQFADDAAWGPFADPKGLTSRQARDLAGIAPGVPGRESAEYLFAYLKAGGAIRGEVPVYVRHVARYGEAGTDGSLLVWLKGASDGGRLGQVDLIKAYQQGLQERGKELDDADRRFAVELVEGLIESKRANEVTAGASLAGAFRLKETTEGLEGIVSKETSPEASRTEALTALAAIDPSASRALLGKILVDPNRSEALRDRAATLLGGTNQAESRTLLVSALPVVPDKLQSSIAAGLAGKREGASALLDAIGAGKASARLLQEQRVAGPLLLAGPADAKDRIAKLLHGLPPADEKLAAVLSARRGAFRKAKAEADAGLKIFETNCKACHQLTGNGGKVGPQLDGIGVRGPDRLMEDILDPGRNVDQTFRTTTLALKDGRVVSGLLLREEGETIVLADAQGKEVRLAKDAVEERTITPLSPMPASFADQIPEADFYRLIAYLLTQKPPG